MDFDFLIDFSLLTSNWPLNRFWLHLIRHSAQNHMENMNICLVCRQSNKLNHHWQRISYDRAM